MNDTFAPPLRSGRSEDDADTEPSRKHAYCVSASQKPDATHVAGLCTWNQLGRRVKKGEKGVRILAPIIGVRRKKDEDAQKDITKQNERVLLGFRNAYVFDVSQTEGVDLPEMHHVSGNPARTWNAWLHLFVAVASCLPITRTSRQPSA